MLRAQALVRLTCATMVARWRRRHIPETCLTKYRLTRRAPGLPAAADEPLEEQRVMTHGQAEASITGDFQNHENAFDHPRQQAASLHASGRADLAVDWYVKAIELEPGDAELRTDLGAAHLSLGQFDAARAQLEQAVALKPDLVKAQANLATTLHILGEKSAARAAYLRACAVQPDFLYARVQALAIAREFVIWEDWQEQVDQLSRATPDPANTAPQLDLIYLLTSPEKLREHAEAYAAEQTRARPAPRGELRRAAANDSRIRIGYVSDELRRHAVGSLAVDAIEQHDRQRFDVHVYDWGPADRSIIERRVAAAATVHDVSSLDAWGIAERVAADSIDVLVDLKGYTENLRLDVFAYRPAPVQMSWLGYPGTLGTDFIDYLVVDQFIVPPGTESGYTEKIIRLPDSYQPNDRDRRIAAPRSRTAYGLPANTTVFGYLGKVGKLNPGVFEDWMQILNAVPGSVLWMLVDSATARRSVLAEAARFGIGRERLFFASALTYADHLARFKVIDVALDAFPWGSHTTASEALWAGCPVVTRAGDTFASRVAGSLLYAAGLPELVAHDAAECRRIAIELGNDPLRRKAFRDRLAATRKTCALFDTPRFTRNLEAAFQATVERARLGLPPVHLDV